MGTPHARAGEEGFDGATAQDEHEDHGEKDMKKTQPEEGGQPSAAEPADDEHGHAQEQEEVGKNGGHDHGHGKRAEEQRLTTGLAQLQPEQTGQSLQKPHQSRAERPGRDLQAGRLRGLLAAVRAG